MSKQTWVREGRHLNITQIRAYNVKKAKEAAKPPVKDEQVVAPVVTPTEVATPIVPVAPVIEPVTETVEDLVVLRAKYLEKTGAEVPNRFKNDVEWIKSKLT